MHPQLALLFHRDDFCQPNASLIRAPVKYQRPNFYYTGNTRMASADTLCKKLLNVKNTVVESHDFYSDKDGVVHLRIKAWHRDDCPFCGRRCPGYDRPVKNRKVWRGLDFGGILVEIEADTHRIHCPEHGVVTAAVPWAYPGSSFTRDFDLTVTWLAEYLSRSAVANYMRIDWQTIGSCISRSLHDLEPERAKRLDGLVNIGIDETSYRKGHKYITVVVNHDTNTVVWVGNGHGKSVQEQFYKALSDEQLASIKVVTGDGAVPAGSRSVSINSRRTVSAVSTPSMSLSGQWKRWMLFARNAGMLPTKRQYSLLMTIHRSEASPGQMTKMPP